MNKVIVLIFFFQLIICYSIAQNILISNYNNPNETSIIIDPKNPNILIAGANMRYCYLSNDTGHTWTRKTLTSNYGVWGDPVIAVDTASNFYYFHLSNPSSGNWIDRIVCQKSLDNGLSWSDGTFAGLNGTKAQDKQWCAIDRRNNNIYLTWTQFDNYGSTNPNDSSIILFSKSEDSGISWTSPIRISKNAGDCIDSDNTVEGAVPAVGINGEIYVSWAGPAGLVFNKSIDYGNTWLENETLIDSFPGGWDYSISGIFRANGLPITACDTSNSSYRGTIYVNWSDQRNDSTNTDIWLSKSTDEGQTWSPPKRVNDDNSNRQQFFTWMTIDQTNGYLYFIFYDRRNHTGDSTDVYIALSTDGGETFINHKISQTPFWPKNTISFGDYTNITAYNGIIRPIWTRMNNSQLSVWTDLTSINDIISSNDEPLINSDVFDFENYPNPSADFAFVTFKLRKSAIINLTIFDIHGKEIVKFISNERMEIGKYIERINFDELNIPSGVYIIRLEIDNNIKKLRHVKI